MLYRSNISSMSINSRWSCQTPFLPFHFPWNFIYTFHFFLKLFYILKLFCNKIKGVHIIKMVQQAKKKSKTPFTICGRSLHISQKVLEWQAPLDCLQKQQKTSFLLKYNTEATHWEIAIYTSGENSMWSFILAFDWMWALDPYWWAMHLNVFLFIATFERSKLFAVTECERDKHIYSKCRFQICIYRERASWEVWHKCIFKLLSHFNISQ